MVVQTLRVDVAPSRCRIGSRTGDGAHDRLVGLRLGRRRMGYAVGLDGCSTEHLRSAHPAGHLRRSGRNSQPDGVETRDTFAAFGLYGFVLVPVTYIATRIWTIRHPGPVVGTGDEGSINGEMGLVLLIGAVSFTVFIIGHMMASMRLTALEQRLERMQHNIDGGA